MHDYEHRRRCADAYLEQQIRIVSRALGIDASTIRVSTTAEDIDGSDLITADGRSVGLRIRRAEIYATHPDDFTVRLRRGRDNRNELDRTKAGVPDLSFVFYHDDSGRIIHWRAFDMSVFRCAADHWFFGIDCELHEGEDSYFVAYSVPSFARYGTFCIAAG